MGTKTIKVTLFIKPNGKREFIDCPNVYPEDADYIINNNIKISMEELDYNNFAIYFDYGKLTEDDEPDEHIEISFGQSCQDTMKKGVEKIKSLSWKK